MVELHLGIYRSPAPLQPEDLGITNPVLMDQTLLGPSLFLWILVACLHVCVRVLFLKDSILSLLGRSLNPSLIHR